MKKALIVSVLIFLLPVVSFAATDKETITVAGTAIGFTASRITTASYQASKASCVLETAQIRFWTTGEDPTASVGILLEVGQSLNLTTRQDVKNFKAIRTGGTSGSLSCEYSE